MGVLGFSESLRSHDWQTEARGLKGAGKNANYFSAQASFGRPKVISERARRLY